MQLENYQSKQAYRMPQTRNLDGIPMNIYEENSARNFRVQSEYEWPFEITELLILIQSLAIRINAIMFQIITHDIIEQVAI